MSTGQFSYVQNFDVIFQQYFLALPALGCGEKYQINRWEAGLWEGGAGVEQCRGDMGNAVGSFTGGAHFTLHVRAECSYVVNSRNTVNK